MADENITTQPQKGISALSLAQLIGAPIRALIEAEAQAAMATANFIRHVGFKPNTTGSRDLGELGELQMARFQLTRSNAQGAEETHELRIPLITLLPIPALQIRDAALEYTVKILDFEVMSESEAQHEPKLASGSRELPATLRATLARESGSTQRRSLDMLLKMKLNMVQSDIPAGLAKLLNITAENINQRMLSNTGPAPDTSDSP